MKLYRLLSEGGRARPVAGEAPVPEPGPGEVRLRVVAASLNYRDILILAAAADGSLDGRIPLSDAAGIVDMLGVDVTGWKEGDRVAASFFLNWISGPFDTACLPTSLGGRATDGVLADFITVPAAALVAVPEHLSFAEAATLPCAAVTAWHGLVVRAGLRSGDTLLVQGTGGVALFGLQFAVALGARAIVLSSSDEKLERARALGAAGLINYRTTPDWHEAVVAVTDGKGASHILELGGRETYRRTLKAVAAGGKIVQIGVLTGAGPKPDLERLQTVNADIIGVTVGSTAHFSAMNAFISEKKLVPVIDRVFPFGGVPEAYEYLRAGAHFGKVVVGVSG
ncbi:zinc-dependent alcohol dehydrogenase family protein [Xanthobacter variabilis]|uniref:zinc-dependent alcohol dehydrogenase family protein n=1 Tax=Xanthobacter variabilis TaxID=3119932 RepID=UPI00374F83D7